VLDISTAAELKKKYYDLFIKDMINRDHYIEIDGVIHSESIRMYAETTELTKKQLTWDFWHWMDEMMQILMAGVTKTFWSEDIKEIKDKYGE